MQKCAVFFLFVVVLVFTENATENKFSKCIKFLDKDTTDAAYYTTYTSFQLNCMKRSKDFQSTC